MQSWDYRVLRHVDADGVETYAIHEVFFDEEDFILGYEKEPVTMDGVDMNDLMALTGFMVEAMSHPVLEAREIPLFDEYLEQALASIDEEGEGVTLQQVVEDLTGDEQPVPHPEQMKVMMSPKLADQIKGMYNEDPERAKELFSRLAGIPADHIKKHGH